MSRLNELIRELCPNGVEFKKLGDVCYILDYKRKPISKSKRNFGNYPYYGANGIQDYIDDFLFDGTFLLIGEDGSVINKNNSPVLNWATGKIWVNNHAHVLSEMREIMLLRFLYFTLSETNISDIVRGTPPKLNQENLRNIKLPVPPLNVQNEIVRILDTFTSHAAELQAELQARKEQYEYYRNKLFDSKIAIEKYKLSDVCIEIGDGLHGTPLYDEKGDYYFINGNNLVKGRITFNTQTKKINYNEFQRIGLKFSTNVVFLSINGTIGNVALYNNEQIALGKSVAYFVVNPLLLNVKFLYYYFLSKYAKIYFELNSTGSTIKNLGLKALRNMIIPIPSLSEQQRIVSILDKFEALVNDLTEGIPAEISAVQEQYEYYRNKLLTFKQRA